MLQHTYTKHIRIPHASVMLFLKNLILYEKISNHNNNACDIHVFHYNSL